MAKRPAKGHGLFYTRDSEGKSDLAPPQYVEWARTEAEKLGVTFNGTASEMLAMIARGQSSSGDLFLDYAISGNVLSRPGFDAFKHRALADLRVSHLFIPRRDRIARPDNPVDGVTMETELRSAGMDIVFLNKVALRIPKGARLELADLLSMLLDFNTSGEFRLELAQKLIAAKVALANQGFSIGGEPPYGFRRWLCAADGAPRRELAKNEVVKMPGHHIVWLPTAHDELAVVRRILDLIKTKTAGRITKILNQDGIRSPNAGRTYTRKGRLLEVSGLWTRNTVENIATHPALVSLMEYGKRGSGDQMRYTPSGPRMLDERDFDSAGRKLTVTNPDDQRKRMPMPGNVKPVIEADERSKILAIVQKRKQSRKGTPRAHGDVPNPLGGRIFDMNCGWPMYRYARRGRFCYTCGLYQNSEAVCCEHNTVSGHQMTRMVLHGVRQKIFTGNRLNKLKDRLRQLALDQQGANGLDARRQTIENHLLTIKKQLEVATRNLTLVEDEEQRSDMQKVYDDLKAERGKLQAELTDFPASDSSFDVEREVEAAFTGVSKFTELVSNPSPDVKGVTDLLERVDAKLFLKFHVVMNGKRKRNVPASAVLNLGHALPPVPLYTGPVDRPIVKKMLAAGESVSPVLGNGSPSAPGSGPSAGWSANDQRVTRHCT